MKTYAGRVTTIRPPGWCNSTGSQKGIRMLNQQTIEKLHTMKLHGMADAFGAQLLGNGEYVCSRQPTECVHHRDSAVV